MLYPLKHWNIFLGHPVYLQIECWFIPGHRLPETTPAVTGPGPEIDNYDVGPPCPGWEMSLDVTGCHMTYDDDDN